MRTIKGFCKKTLPTSLWTGLIAARMVNVRIRQRTERYLNYKRRQSVQKLLKLKNKHHGERCFIIGNGPSLNKMDLSLLKHEVTFGLNRIYLLFDQMGFSTTYYVCVNSLVIEQCANEIKQLPMTKFISWRSKNLIEFTPSTLFIDTSAAPQFSHDITHSINEGGTVTFVAIQIAFYLGFSEVILIGIDHHFTTQGKPNSTVISTSSDRNHFDPNYFGTGFRWQLPDLETSEISYRIAKFQFEQDEREILDATIDGNLYIFKKVDYHSLFK